MFTRRSFLFGSSAIVATPQLGRGRQRTPPAERGGGRAFTPVRMPNGRTLPYELDGNVKVFRLVAEEVLQEFAPGMVVKCWGYNGSTPGPLIEAVEGDRVRILVTNRLPAPTSVHWHGLLLPNTMDGVAGVSQHGIPPGATVAYEFPLRQHGTHMYHPHADEAFQIMLGMVGFFVIHPRRSTRSVDRDYAIFLHEWAVPPGSARPDPTVMTDFNLFTFNGKVWPGTEHLLARRGERMRIRFGNVTMNSHPIHMHGVQFWVTGTDGGPIPRSGWWPETTVNVPPGTTRDIEMVPGIPGDWPLHCHKPHHTMNAMGHELPNMIGVDQDPLVAKIRKFIPGWMPMGETGMIHMHGMDLPENTLPMMSGKGPYGGIDMGGMFTVVKVREEIDGDAAPGWYEPGDELRPSFVDE